MRAFSLLLLLSLAVSSAAQEPSSSTPVRDLLRADGTLDLNAASGAGALDLSGYEVSMTDRGLHATVRAEDEWSTFARAASGAPLGDVNELVAAPDGTLYAAANGLLGVASWNGSQWRRLGRGVGGDIQGTGVQGIVRAIALAPDGTLYAGGSFSAFGNGDPASNIAAWDGTEWSDVGAGLDGPVTKLAVAANGWVYVAVQVRRNNGLETHIMV